MKRSCIFLVVTLALASAAADVSSQTIPIRTVPVASGDQYRMLPSATMSMGGVRLAVDDSVAGAWSNPAKGVLISESSFFGSPTFYSISREGGGGRTFPVAGLFAGSTWFGGASLALQQIENDDGSTVFFGSEPWIDVCCGPVPAPRTLSGTYGRNLYASGFVGRRLAGDWSLGAGGGIAQLGAMDGVDLLYAGSESIDQSGRLGNAQVGLFRNGQRDRLSLLALYAAVDMTHEVAFVDWIWDPVAQRTLRRSRLESNEDRSRTWGGHVAWDRTLSTPGWRIGASGTLNYKTHPKIPNYTIQNIPRDPGTTWAWEAAVGFSRRHAATTFALDLALQPIWSETWQVANDQDVLDSGQRLRVGDRSIENEFSFTNAIIRSGVSHDIHEVGLQAGLEIRSYAYELQQVDHVDRTFREQDESWIEWSPTFGALFRLGEMELRYSGRLTTGTGRPGTAQDFATPGNELLDSSDFILAPGGPLTLVDARVTTHQLSLRIPIR